MHTTREPQTGASRLQSLVLSGRGLTMTMAVALVAIAVYGAEAAVLEDALVVAAFLAGLACAVLALVGARPAGRTIARAGRRVGEALAFFFVVSLAVLLPAAALDSSSRNLARPLHLAIVIVAGALLVWALVWISTEDLRHRSVTFLGDVKGPLILGALVLVTAAQLLASITFILYDNEILSLSPTDSSRSLSEPLLFDFYMWHFLDAIPLLSITEVARLDVPVTYSSPAVGLLVLAFQGIAVLIFIPTVRWFVRNRKQRAHSAQGEGAA